MALRKLVCALLVFSFIASCAPKEAMKGHAVLTNAVIAANAPSLVPVLASVPEQMIEKKPEPVRVETKDNEQYVVLNFDNADMDTVIATFGELLNINYLMAPGISGKVTIQSYRKFPKKDLFRIFQSILELNGLTAVQDGPLYRIVPIDTARQQPLKVEEGKEVKYVLDSSFITQLVPLQYVKAGDIANVLRSLMPRGTDIVIYEPANLLIITGRPATLARLMKIIEALDVAETERESVRTFVYYVENGEAKKLEGILRSLFSEKGKSSSGPVQAPIQQRRPVLPGMPMQPAAVPGGANSIPADIGEASITAYEDINALIVKTTPRGYLSFLELMKRLDIPPKQVLIEVLVAEVTLSDQNQFGVEWLLKKLGSMGSIDSAAGGFNNGNIAIDPNTGDLVPQLTTGAFSGIMTGVFDSTRLALALKALSTMSRLNVLASPHILAMDNKEAKIEIGSEVPIATGQFVQQPATAGTNVISFNTASQIQYKTIGTLLTVTPHITEHDNVLLKIQQEVSQPGAVVPVAGQDFQSFDTRKTDTTALVEDGHTLLIGGLMRESKNFGRSGIPFLSKIPLLGYLFSATTETYDKTELIVLVTPHVVANQDEADEMTAEFQDRVQTVKRIIQEKDSQKSLKEKEKLQKEEKKKSLEKKSLAPAPPQP